MRTYTRRTLGIAGALFLASCFGDSTGPALRRRVPLSIAPVFDSRDARAVLYDKVRVHLVRPGTNELVLDTVVDFPSTADSIVLSLSVPVQGSSETLALSLSLFTAAGDTVFRGGPVSVDVLPGVLNAAPATIPMAYVGTGANATGVTFVTIPGPVLIGDTALFVAQADTAGSPIPGTPIVYAVDARDTALASVPNPDVGRVAAKSGRATARVIARLLTHQADTASLVIQPLPSAIVVRSGGGQSGSAGSLLSQPIVVRVNGADNIGIAGVTVAFAPSTGGGGVSPTSAVTDANGDASTTWTLGALVGSQAITATVGSVSSGPISATATPASASKLGFTVQPVTTVAGATIPAITVAAQDVFGNLFTGFAGRVSVALGSNPGGATLSGTTTASTVAGVATFADLSLDKAGTGYTLVASVSGLTSATSAGFNITAGAARTLSLVSGGGQSGAPNGQLALPVVVKAADSLGNGVSGRSVAFAASAGGSVGTAAATTDALGLASTTWTLGVAAVESLTVTSAGLTGSPLTVTATASGIVSTTVTPHLDTLTALTATFQLAAQSHDAVGGLVSGTYTWVSRTPTIATVGTTGLVTAVANGSSWVVATEAGGTKDSAQIVVQQRVATVTVTPSARNIYLTRWVAFTAAAVDGKGFAVPGTPTFTWTSTAPAVATVDATGLVTGVGLGSAQIRAATGGVTGVSNVQIITPITRIAVVVDTVNAAKTDTFTLTALGLTRRYRAIAHDTLDAVMSGLSFTWVSTNGSVAQMLTVAGDTASVLSAANGYTQVQATAQGFTSVPGASLTVSQVLAAIALTPASAGIAPTGTVGLVARGLDANGRFISGGSFKYFAADTTIAKVDSLTGVVTGVGLGSTTVTATSGAITSNPSVILVSASVPAVITFGRDTVSVGRGSSASIPILLSRPVPVGGPSLTVNLGTNPAAYAHWSTASVTIPQGGTSANATLVGDSAGTTLVTAADGSGLGYAPDTAVAKVTANMRLASSGYAINATDVATTQVLLSDPSPAGGTYVTFSYGTPGIASVSPDPAYIPAGQLAADIQIRGLAGGSTTITPVAIGVNGTASNFTAYAPVLTPYPSSLLLGQGQYEQYAYVQLPTYTNVPVSVTITSSDSTVAYAPASVTVPSGQYYSYFPITGRAVGSASLSLSATGWTASRGVTVTVSPPRVGICCTNSSLFTTSPQQNATVYAEDSTGSSHYRVNSLVVQLRSTDATIIKLVDSTVTIPPGATSTSGRFVMGGLVGSAWIVATASGHAPDSVQYTVRGPPLSFNWGGTPNVGAGQFEQYEYVQTPTYVTAPLVVTLTSSDTTVVTVPPTVTIAQGSYYAYFNVTGVAPGSATIQAAAPGYQPDTGAYRVTSPFLTACCNNASLANFGPGASLTIYPADSVRTVHWQTAPLTVSIASSDTTIIRVDSSSVTIGAGQSYNGQARVMPVGVGTARVILSAAGHPALDTLTYTVVSPKLSFSFTSSTLGRRQRYSSDGQAFFVRTPDYRSSPLSLTITQKQGRVDTLTTTTPTIGSGTYYVYLDAFGLFNGTDTLIVAAPGYLPDTAFITVTTPKFVTGTLSSSLTTTSPPFQVVVYPADSTTTTHYTMDTVVVAAVSSDTNVLRPRPFFRIPQNAPYGYDSVFVVGAGPVNLVFSDSAGTGYLPDTTNTVTVTGPSLAISNSTPVLGMRQTNGQYSAYVQVPNNVASALVVHLLSTDPRVVTVPDSVIIPAGTYYQYFPITAMDTVGTIQVQASATGYGGAATNVQVTQPKFVISANTYVNTTAARQYFYVYAADAGGSTHQTTEDVTVTLASSAPSVASIDSGTVTIPKGAYYSYAATWGPGQVGTAQLSASDTRAQLYRYNADTVAVQVVTPTVGLNVDNALGIGQYQDFEYVSTPDYMTAPTTVTLSHVGTARTGTYANQTNTPVTQVTIDSAAYYTYFRLAGLVSGTDTLVASIASPLHNPDSALVVVGPGRVDPLGGWPTAVAVGDSVQVTLYTRDPNGGTRFVVAATQFTFSSISNIQLWSGGANSVQLTSVTVPADAGQVSFYVKGTAAGTGTMTITGTNYQSYLATLTVSP